MKNSPAKVLVVEDSGPFRSFVRAILSEMPELQVVGEISNGLQAVEIAKKLQPDLILLDIGLPSLNGIEAARRIRRISPGSKLLFLSQESSVEVVQEALLAGSHGYVVKIDAGRELLAAVSAVLRGEQFVGHRFAGQDFAGDPGQTSARLLPYHVTAKGTAAYPAFAADEIRHRHEVEFCHDDSCFVDAFARFSEAALRKGSSVIVVASHSHLASLFQRLGTDGVDVEAAIEAKCYIPLNVHDMLATFMQNERVDPVRFAKATRELITEASTDAKGGKRHVAACGECAPTLLGNGNSEAAVQVEQLWDEVGRTYNVEILCGYALSAFGGMEADRLFERICAEHSAIYSPQMSLATGELSGDSKSRL